MSEITLHIEVLEERIAPDVAPGLLGYEGQPGNQGDQNNGGTPESNSAVPEVPAGNTPQPNP